MREITLALRRTDFDEINRGGVSPISDPVRDVMTEYEEGWPYPVAFTPEHPATTIASCIRGPRRASVARRRDGNTRT